jgi:LysM repeat protein
MRKLYVLLLLIFSLAACNQNENGGATTPAADSGVVSDTTDDDSPRVAVVPTASLPATWTPLSRVHGGHLYLLPVSGAAGTPVIHVVQPGETVAALCARYQISIEDLARLNNVQNWDDIEAGTVLFIPPSTN